MPNISLSAVNPTDGQIGAVGVFSRGVEGACPALADLGGGANPLIGVAVSPGVASPTYAGAVTLSARSGSSSVSSPVFLSSRCPPPALPLPGRRDLGVGEAATVESGATFEGWFRECGYPSVVGPSLGGDRDCGNSGVRVRTFSSRSSVTDGGRGNPVPTTCRTPPVAPPHQQCPGVSPSAGHPGDVVPPPSLFRRYFASPDSASSSAISDAALRADLAALKLSREPVSAALLSTLKSFDLAEVQAATQLVLAKGIRAVLESQRLALVARSGDPEQVLSLLAEYPDRDRVLDLLVNGMASHMVPEFVPNGGRGFRF